MGSHSSEVDSGYLPLLVGRVILPSRPPKELKAMLLLIAHFCGLSFLLSFYCLRAAAELRPQRELSVSIQ